jgi:hypothetical protein
VIVKSHRGALLAALADEEIVKIMNCVMYNSKSFNDIIHENNDMPRTTTFRRINWLLNEPILVDKVTVTEAGKKFSLYHSTLKAISVRYENKDVIVQAEENFDIAKREIFFVRLFVNHLQVFGNSAQPVYPLFHPPGKQNLDALRSKSLANNPRLLFVP